MKHLKRTLAALLAMLLLVSSFALGEEVEVNLDDTIAPEIAEEAITEPVEQAMEDIPAVVEDIPAEAEEIPAEEAVAEPAQADEASEDIEDAPQEVEMDFIDGVLIPKGDDVPEAHIYDVTVDPAAKAQTQTISVGDTVRVRVSGAEVTAWKPGKNGVVSYTSGSDEFGAYTDFHADAECKKLSLKATITGHKKKNATLNLVINNPYLPTAISFKSSMPESVPVGTTIKLPDMVTVEPSYAVTKLTYKVSGKAANVTKDGTLVTKSAGMATITVIASNNAKAKAPFSLKVLANKLQKMNAKPTKSNFAGIEGKWTLWPLSVEPTAKGVNCQFYLLNASGEKCTAIENMTITLAAGSRSNIIARYSNVGSKALKVNASNNKSAIVKLTMTPMNMDGVFLPEYYQNGTLYFDINQNDVVLTSKKGRYGFIPTQFPTYDPEPELDENPYGEGNVENSENPDTDPTSNPDTDPTSNPENENSQPITNISLEPNSITLYVGDTYTINPTITPVNSDNTSLIWYSSNKTIATVKDGIVSAVDVGEATITAQVIGSSIQSDCVVTVIKRDIDERSYSLLGNARYIDNGTVELTPLRAWRAGAMWFDQMVYTKGGFSVDFDYWIGGGRDDSYGGADGLAVVFNKTIGLGEQGGWMGIPNNSDVYAVEFDSYPYNDGDPRKKHIAVIQSVPSNHLQYVIDDRVDDSMWHKVKIEYNNNDINVQVDGSTVVECKDLVLSEFLNIGITSSTGSGKNRHIIKDFTLHQNVQPEATQFSVEHKLEGTVIADGASTGKFYMSPLAEKSGVSNLTVNCNYNWTVTASDESWMSAEKISDTQCQLTVGEVYDDQNYSTTLTFTAGPNTYTVDVQLLKKLIDTAELGWNDTRLDKEKVKYHTYDDGLTYKDCMLYQVALHNSLLLQKKVDAGGTVVLPVGTFYFAPTSTYGRSAEISYAIRLASNVTIKGQGTGKTILKPLAQKKEASSLSEAIAQFNKGFWQANPKGMDMFYFNDYADSMGDNYLYKANFEDFKIDASECSKHDHDSGGKGFMINLMKECSWNNVTVEHTDGSGFGVDCPIDCTMTNCNANYCGKASLNVMPGGSGFGIGIGYDPAENMTITNCHATGNGKFGFFFEHQKRFDKEKYRAGFTTTKYLFVVQDCTATDNLYNFGGLCAYNVLYDKDCKSIYSDSYRIKSLARGEKVERTVILSEMQVIRDWISDDDPSVPIKNLINEIQDATLDINSVKNKNTDIPGVFFGNTYPEGENVACVNCDYQGSYEVKKK